MFAKALSNNFAGGSKDAQFKTEVDEDATEEEKAEAEAEQEVEDELEAKKDKNKTKKRIITQTTHPWII